MIYILADIHAAITMEVNEDMATDSVGPSLEKPQPNTFDHLFEDAQHPLYVGCTSFLILSFIVKFFNMLIKLLKTVFYNSLLPNSFHEAHKL